MNKSVIENSYTISYACLLTIIYTGIHGKIEFYSIICMYASTAQRGPADMMALHTITGKQQFCEEPTARNSKRLPQKGKGAVPREGRISDRFCIQGIYIEMKISHRLLDWCPMVKVLMIGWQKIQPTFPVRCGCLRLLFFLKLLLQTQIRFRSSTGASMCIAALQPVACFFFSAWQLQGSQATTAAVQCHVCSNVKCSTGPNSTHSLTTIPAGRTKFSPFHPSTSLAISTPYIPTNHPRRQCSP